LATTGIVYHFPASILSAFEYRGNGMEKAQERMDKSGGLFGKRQTLLCNQQMVGHAWKVGLYQI
jgi:hypothetical protein